MRAAALVALLGLASSGFAHAHDWYPRNCCSSKDCFAMEPGEYRIEIGGIRIVATGELFPHSAVRRDAPDGLVHRCTYGASRKGLTIMRSDGPCVWAPETGM